MSKNLNRLPHRFPNSMRTLILLGVLAQAINAANAQDIQAITQREIARRQAEAGDAQNSLAQAEKAYKEKDYETAYVKYLDAVDSIPAGAASAKTRGPVLAKFSEAAIAYAGELVRNGRYSDAEKVAKTVLLPQYNPGYRPAIQFLSNLEQPDYFNKTVTPEFSAQRDQVTKLLTEADGYYATGRLDLAIKRYEQVLNIDRYNKAARMGMERVNNQKINYYTEAYNETRSRMLWEVTRAWERPVRRFDQRDTGADGGSRTMGVSSTEAISAKLNRIIIPKVDLTDVSIREAVELLQQRSRELDNTTTETGQKRGVNIVLKLPNQPSEPPVGAATDPTAAAPAAPVVTPDTKVTMSLSNVPMVEAIRYLTELAGLKYKVEPYAVSIVPVSENTDDLVTKEYRVPPGFIPASNASADSALPVAGARSSSDAIGEKRVKGRIDALDFLKSQGVPFPTGAFAQYVPAGSRLIVRNTQNSIDLIDTLVEAASGAQPTQVEIESKFLEITQNNLDELGFNWLVGPFAIGDGVYGAGGTQGYNRGVQASTYPFGNIGQNPVTGGLRSGVGNTPDAAVTANSIDALIANIPQGASAAAPGVFGLAGIFTNPQFQVVIRALSQKKGVDLMTAPKVTTKSGIKATIKVVREFPYPTQFDPPQPPVAATNGSGSGSSVVGIATGQLLSNGVVTPSTPTEFQTRDLGVTLEVDPAVGPDNYTIDLNLAPQVVDFDGFVNYGSPILGARFISPLQGGLPPLGTIQQTVLTPNTINQPIFSTRRVQTNVSIWDGQTVALGGLIREDVQKVQDKVPILGDVPLAGRLFRSNVDQKIKRNLIIFVTARIMDAEGRPIRRDDEQEEVVEPLGLPENLPPPAFQQQSYGK